MTKALRKIITLLMCFSLAAALFSEPKSTGITDTDVKNWSKNLNNIVKELQSIGAWSDEAINATAKQKNAVDSILNKNGISGSNCIEKFGMITSCAVVAIAETEIDAESAALLKAMGMDPMAEFKKNVNSKDYAVVAANAKAVVKAYNNLDTSSFEQDDYDIPDYGASYDNEEYSDFLNRLGDSFNKVGQESSNLSMNEVNEYGKMVKDLYEQVNNAAKQKSNGNSAFFYKKSGYASKYKKASYKKGTKIKLNYGSDSDINDSAVDWTFNLDKKTVELIFTWKEATLDYAINGYSVKTTSKTLNYTIAAIDYYYLTEDPGRRYGEGYEYVVKTKEGPVFNFWIEYDGDYNSFSSHAAINGDTEIDRTYFQWLIE